MPEYKVAEKSIWQGRAGEPKGSRYFQVVECIDLEHSCESGAFALLGFASDEGVKRNQGRTGAIEGPEALRKALAKLPLHWKSAKPIYDFGDICCNDGDLESAQALLAEVVSDLLQKGLHPLVMGGGHEISWGHFQGIAASVQDQQCGILNFDAHFDLRPLLKNGQGSSGTPFYQIAQNYPFDYTCLGIQPFGNGPNLFKEAQKHSVKYLTAEEMCSVEKAEKMVKELVGRHEAIYLTICLDVFAEAYAPGVSAPQAMGLSPWQVIPLVQQLAASGKVVSMDIAEMAPCFDRNSVTAQLGASLLSTFIHASP